MKFGKYLLLTVLLALLLTVAAGAEGYEVVVDFSEQSAQGQVITYVSEEHRLFAAKLTTYPQEDQYGIYDFDGNLLLTLEEGVIPHFTPVGIAMEEPVASYIALWGFYSYDLECLLPRIYENMAVCDENTLLLIDGVHHCGRVVYYCEGTVFSYDLRTGAMTELGEGRTDGTHFDAPFSLEGQQEDLQTRGCSGPMWRSQLPSPDGPLGLWDGGIETRTGTSVAFTDMWRGVANRDREMIAEPPEGLECEMTYGWDGRIIYLLEGSLENYTHSIYSGRGRLLFRRNSYQWQCWPFAEGQYFTFDDGENDWPLVDFYGNPIELPAGSGRIRGNYACMEGSEGYECCTDNNHLLIVDGLGIIRMPELAPQPSEWAAADTAEAVELGLVDEDIQWWWQDSCTREEFCRILIHGLERITGKTTAELTEGLELPAFSDCDSEAIRTAAALGIVRGVGNEKFAPIRFVRRQEAAAMLSRAAEYLGYEAEGEPATFADADQFDTWAQEPIAFVSALPCGPEATPLMQGKSENRFAPRDPYTVEQAAITVLRLVEK